MLLDWFFINPVSFSPSLLLSPAPGPRACASSSLSRLSSSRALLSSSSCFFSSSAVVALTAVCCGWRHTEREKKKEQERETGKKKKKIEKQRMKQRERERERTTWWNEVRRNKEGKRLKIDVLHWNILWEDIWSWLDARNNMPLSPIILVKLNTIGTIKKKSTYTTS